MIENLKDAKERLIRISIRNNDNIAEDVYDILDETISLIDILIDNEKLKEDDFK